MSSAAAGDGEGVRLQTPSETEEDMTDTYTLPILSDDEDEFEFLIRSRTPHGKAHRVKLTCKRAIVASDDSGIAPPVNTQEQASDETAQRGGHMPRNIQDHGVRNTENAKPAVSIFARRSAPGADQPGPWVLLGPAYAAAHGQLPVRHARRSSTEASVASTSSSMKPGGPASRDTLDGVTPALAPPPVRTWSTDGNVGDHTDECGCIAEEAEDGGAFVFQDDHDHDGNHHEDVEDEYCSDDDVEAVEYVEEEQDDLSSHGKKAAAKSTSAEPRKSRKVGKEPEYQQKQSRALLPSSEAIEPEPAHACASDNHTWDSLEAATTILDTAAHHEFWSSLVAEGKVTPETAKARSGAEDMHFKTPEQIAQEIADEEFARKVQAEIQEEMRWTEPEFGSEVGQFSGRKFP